MAELTAQEAKNLAEHSKSNNVVNWCGSTAKETQWKRLIGDRAIVEFDSRIVC